LAILRQLQTQKIDDAVYPTGLVLLEKEGKWASRQPFKSVWNALECRK
jgi:hypothetical protein